MLWSLHVVAQALRIGTVGGNLDDRRVCTCNNLSNIQQGSLIRLSSHLG